MTHHLFLTHLPGIITVEPPLTAPASRSKASTQQAAGTGPCQPVVSQQRHALSAKQCTG